MQELLKDLKPEEILLWKYKAVIQKYSNFKVSVILTDLPNSSISFGASELVKLVTGQKHVLMYENIGNLKVMDTPLAFQKANRKPLNVGELYMFNEGDFMKIKTPVWR